MEQSLIEERFETLGREDALCANPIVSMDDESLWLHARRVVSNRLRGVELSNQEDTITFKSKARSAYVEGWHMSQQLMEMPPLIRMQRHIWTIGYRSKSDCDLLETLFQSADKQSPCRLLVDIRYRPLAPYQPQWSRKRLQSRYQHQYRYLHALGNKHYNQPGLPIALVDAEAGINVLVRWVQAGWDIILLCACEEADGCHRTDVMQLLECTIGDDPRIVFHQDRECSEENI